MRLSRSLMLCAVCAISVCLFGAGKSFKLNDADVLLRDAQAHLAQEQTPEVFARHYAKLHAKDPELAKRLAVLYFWLVEDEAVREQIFATGSRARQGGGIVPMRVAAPITRLTVTAFSIGTTSFVFRAEWPIGMEFPQEELYVMSNLDLSVKWWSHLATVKINPAQGWKNFEVPYDDIPSIYMDDINFAQKAFFKLQPAEPDEVLFDGGGDKDDEDSEDPEIPPQLNWISEDHYFHRFLASVSNPISNESIPLTSGRSYLITLHYYAAHAGPFGNPLELPNTFYTWDISLPDGQSMSGSTDAQTIWAATPSGNYDIEYNVLDLCVVHVPFFEQPVAGPQLFSAPNAWTVEASSTVASDHPERGVGLLTLTFTVLTIVQDNISTISYGTNPGTTDPGGEVTYLNLRTNGVAFISGTPLAPELKMAVIPRGLDLAFRMEIESERKDLRKEIDDRKYPADGSWYEHLDGLSPFNITDKLMNNEIIGGKCKLHYKIKSKVDNKEIEGMFPFYIRGLNPPDAVVRDYISDTVADAFKGYAWSIYQHETRSGAFVFNQFNVRGQYKHLPNWGKPDGWGITQIDRSKSKGVTTTEEVYNWRTNILNGSSILSEKLATHKDMLAKIKRSYPDKWVEPPATILFSNSMWSTEQLAVTVLYNGAAGVTETAVITNNNSKLWGKIKSPLVFNEKASPANRWSFCDNRTNYAFKVTREFFPETQPPPQE